MIARTQIESILKASCLGHGVPEAALARLAGGVTVRRYRRGEHAWREGETAAWMAVVGSGLVKVVQPRTGTTVAMHGARETVGEIDVVAEGPYGSEAVAMTAEVELLALEATEVRAMMNAQPAFALGVARALTARSRALEEKIRILSAGGAEQRVATLILHLLERFGDEMEDGTHLVPLSLTRGELAAFVGATMETTIRIMSRWHKEGTVLTQADGLRIQALDRFAAVARGRTPAGDTPSPGSASIAAAE